MVSQTSLMSYATIRNDLSKRERQVLEIIEEHQPIDNQGIADLMNEPVNRITGRTNALANPKTLLSDIRPSLIEVKHIKENKYGNKSKHWGVK